MLKHKNFVFVLGAGASVDFGFPTGAELKDLIVTKLADTSSLEYEALRGVGVHRRHIEEFAFSLGRSPMSSVDGYLAKVPPVGRFVGKLAIAACLMSFESKYAIHKPRKENWFNYLYQKMEEGAKSIEEFYTNKVAFITYNYDRSLEELFSAAFSSHYRPDPGLIDMAKTIPIIHVHGQLGHHPSIHLGQGRREYDAMINNPKALKIAADGIRIINENIGGNSAFRRAHIVLENADIVCFLGFGYLEKNLARLRLSKSKCVTFYGTTLGMENPESNYVKELFCDRSFTGYPLTISAFFRKTGVLLQTGRSLFDRRKLKKRAKRL
jgi:hypothetical protein